MSIRLKIPSIVTQIISEVVYSPLTKDEWSCRSDGPIDIVTERIRYGLKNYASYVLIEFFEKVASVAMLSVGGSNLVNYERAREEAISFEFTHPDAPIFDDFMKELRLELNNELRVDEQDVDGLLTYVTITSTIEDRSKRIWGLLSNNDEVTRAVITMADAIVESGYMSFDTAELVDILMSGDCKFDVMVRINTFVLDDFVLATTPVDYADIIENDLLTTSEVRADWQWRISHLSNMPVGTWFVLENEDTIFTNFNALPIYPNARYEIYTVDGDYGED